MARIRPLTEDDAPVAAEIAQAAFAQVDEAYGAYQVARVTHFARHDGPGAWAAEDDATGELAGVALALLRDGLWGLSLLVVRPDRQSGGIGRALLDAALTYGAPHRGGVVLSSEDPRALRRYARAGFALHPTVAAAGVVDRRGLPAGLRSRIVTLDEAEPIAAAAGRAVRGAAYARSDLELAAARPTTLLACGSSALAMVRDGVVSLVAAPDADRATDLLQSALAHQPRGGSCDVERITSGQDWAVPACLDAGLALTPWAPLFTSGAVRPDAGAWLPSGALL